MYWPRLFQFKVVSISQPRWLAMLWGRELIPGVKPSTWSCFSHDQQCPLDRLPFPFEEQGAAKAQETHFSLRDVEWLPWFWVLQRLSTDQDRQKQRIFRSMMKGRFVLLEISHQLVSDCRWTKCLWLYLNNSPKNRAHLTCYSKVSEVGQILCGFFFPRLMNRNYVNRSIDSFTESGESEMVPLPLNLPLGANHYHHL